jgi:hypothetical protein
VQGSRQPGAADKARQRQGETSKNNDRRGEKYTLRRAQETENLISDLLFRHGDGGRPDQWRRQGPMPLHGVQRVLARKLARKDGR